jgi:GIY-YIG catalytic domain-containing protein
MLTFNTILRHEGIEPSNVQLVRHQDNRAIVSCTPYNLWRAGDGRLELYQRIQKREVFGVGSILATFVATPADETLFIGLYHVDGIGVAPPGTIDPVVQEERGGLHLYEIRREDGLSDYAGHLIIDWGKGFRSWVQRADRQDKPVLEIRKEVREQPFPGFTQFCWDIDQIAAVPLPWQEVLKSVKGVYLLVCKETGKQYVGSAKGEESLWGRFLDYARTGHGGNVELKQRGSRQYRVTVLEVVNSDTGIERVEEAWKQKLMSRKFGLNKN